MSTLHHPDTFGNGRILTYVQSLITARHHAATMYVLFNAMLPHNHACRKIKKKIKENQSCGGRRPGTDVMEAVRTTLVDTYMVDRNA